MEKEEESNFARLERSPRDSFANFPKPGIVNSLFFRRFSSVLSSGIEIRSAKRLSIALDATTMKSARVGVASALRLFRPLIDCRESMHRLKPYNLPSDPSMPPIRTVSLVKKSASARRPLPDSSNISLRKCENTKCGRIETLVGTLVDLGQRAFSAAGKT